jgi:cell division protease FtsH
MANDGDRKGRWPGFDLGGGGSPDGPRKMRTSPLIYLLGFFAIALLLSRVLTTSSSIPFSQFLDKVDSGQVVGTVQIGTTDVSGTYRDPGGNEVPFSSTLPPNYTTNSLGTQLTKAGVQWQGVQPNGLLTFLVGTLLPMLLLFGVLWFFLFRRMSGGAGAALNLGKNKVKIYDRKEMKTSFSDVAGVDEATRSSRRSSTSSRTRRSTSASAAGSPRACCSSAPGCGKTLLAARGRRRGERPVLLHVGLEFVEMFVGLVRPASASCSSRRRRRRPPRFLDEIDTIGKGRVGALGAGSAPTTSASRR